MTFFREQQKKYYPRLFFVIHSLFCFPHNVRLPKKATSIVLLRFSIPFFKSTRRSILWTMSKFISSNMKNFAIENYEFFPIIGTRMNQMCRKVPLVMIYLVVQTHSIQPYLLQSFHRGLNQQFFFSARPFDFKSSCFVLNRLPDGQKRQKLALHLDISLSSNSYFFNNTRFISSTKVASEG